MLRVVIHIYISILFAEIEEPSRSIDRRFCQNRPEKRLERKTRRRGIKARSGGGEERKSVSPDSDRENRVEGEGRKERKKILFHPSARPAACTRRYPHTCREYILIRRSPGLNIYASCRLRCKSPQRPFSLPSHCLCIFVQPAYIPAN